MNLAVGELRRDDVTQEVKLKRNVLAREIFSRSASVAATSRRCRSSKCQKSLWYLAFSMWSGSIHAHHTVEPHDCKRYFLTRTLVHRWRCNSVLVQRSPLR